MKPLPTRPEADSLIVGTLRERGCAPQDFKPEGEQAREPTRREREAPKRS